jgi:hypothetical protein
MIEHERRPNAASATPVEGLPRLGSEDRLNTSR